MDERRQPHINGTLKGSKTPNGSNGNDSFTVINGRTITVAPRRSIPRRRQRGFFARSINAIARLLTWYSIFTVLFRCPASLDACDGTSPKICKPYFHAKHALAPHVVPYYDAYAAPYVDLTRPYYQTFDRMVLTPGRVYAVKYGGPRVSQAQAFGQAQWEKNVQPQILKYRALAKVQYGHTVSPYVDKAATTIAPYYNIARTNALQTYHEILVPTYTLVRPYATQTYNAAYDIAKDRVVPSTVWAWNKTFTFVDSAVWPHVRDVYVLKVEPQLARIGQRLGRYKDKKPKSALEETEPLVPKSTFIKPTSSASSTTLSATREPSQTASRSPDSESSSKIKAPPNVQSKSSGTPKTKEEIRELASKTVAEDLELWEGKFSKVAEEGASEIEDRVDEISARMIEHQAGGMGKSLVAQLEATAHAELDSLKKAIIDILQSSRNDPEERDEKITTAVRAAGLKIKSKAQNVRDWRHGYEQETEIAVTKAAEEHFSILEQTRDLALQKIGMKWAWMDGVTYKDWQKYHQLRARFEEWTEDLKQLVTTHPGLVAAQTAGIDVEDEGMAIAHEAAVELGRLRQVAVWKATAEDFTDDFDSNTMQLAAEAAEKRIEEAAESARLAAEAVADDVETSGEAMSESASEMLSGAIPTQDNIPGSLDADTEQTETVTISLSRNNLEPEDLDTSALPPLESSAAEPTDSATGIRSGLADDPAQLQETLLESSDLPIHSVEEEARSTTVKSALFGVAAESIPTRQPILDDDTLSSASSVLSVVQSDVPASITSAAQAAYTAAIIGAADQYSRAMSAVSAQISGEPKPFQEEMFSSASNGYFSAMAAANSRLNEAIAVASGNLYGTPTANWASAIPTVPSVDWERVQSIAQQRLQDSVDWASNQYESAKVAIGAAEPTPSTYLEAAEKRAEKLFDQAKHNYYAGVGIAHAQYSEFLAAASTAMSTLTATPTPTNIQESASSALSAASEAVGSVASSVNNVAQDAKDSVEESWDLLISQISSQIYGAPTPTPWYDDLAASATEAVADRMSAASSVVDEYVASANSAASSQYVAVSSLVSELMLGKEPSYTESVYLRLAQAYTTGLSSVSSIASAASATAVSAASKISDAVSSGIETGGDNIASATDKVKDTVGHVKDEL
ncbi:putative transcription factor [Rosellinia necatrix]|uniref:Putative transcription factor n=1 Tax=Rosellinia necatrix TaxID=77044 RepID=A0A1W2TN64_ROSNE|nr:putative transcription factor [Rosellinia necatrix]